MKILLAKICLWILAKTGYQTEFILPPSMLPFADEMTSLIQSESELTHGSTDVLGDSWLKFMRVAQRIKKNHPEISKRDIFKAIIMIHEVMEKNVQV
jgi:hypothetical protein